jgi:tRNA(fMet)-specific endonuclease VapC
MKILGSDHCVALLRGNPDLRERGVRQEPLAVTSISVAELTHGAYKSAHSDENIARLDVLLSAVTVLSFDTAAACRCGELKARLERAGTPLADLDLQIAAIALSQGYPLVTHNTRHFSRVPGLQLEDWLR